MSGNEIVVIKIFDDVLELHVATSYNLIEAEESVMGSDAYHIENLNLVKEKLETARLAKLAGYKGLL